MIPKVFTLIILVHLTVHCAYGQKGNKYFRKDYKFLEDTETFYKIHKIAKSWLDAKKTCAREGAHLYYPEDLWEFETVERHLKDSQLEIPENIYIGVSSMLAPGIFDTVDATRLDDVYNKWKPIDNGCEDGESKCVSINRNDGTMKCESCGTNLPFVCKKTLATLEWSEECRMPYKGYEYAKDLGRCYKFHLVPRNWTEAYATCISEQSYLVVLNSQAEHDYLLKMIERAPKESVNGDHLRGVILTGFHNRFDEGWRTIKGTTLEESGYSEWAYTEPNGGGKEKCGSMYNTGTLNDLGCSWKCFFVCEHEMENQLNDRFNEVNNVV